MEEVLRDSTAIVHQASRMVVRVHDDGWLALPAAFHCKLNLGTSASSRPS